MGTVPGQTTIARLHMAELALEHAERMFDPGAHLRDDPVDLIVERVNRVLDKGDRAGW